MIDLLPYLLVLLEVFFNNLLNMSTNCGVMWNVQFLELSPKHQKNVA